jgi:hypothetical protein
MRTTLQKIVLTLLAFVAGQCATHADVTSYAIFKVANYHQVDAAQPAGLDVPNAYYFGSQLFANDLGELVTNSVMTGPDSTVYPMPGSPVPFAFFYNTPYYPDEASFNTAYPNSTYEFLINDATDSGELDMPPEDLYTTSIPYFNGDTWSRMQHVNAARPLNLTWNAFVPNPDASSAYVFVRILDPSFNYAYTTNFIAFDVTNICIPADSLSAATTYQIQVLFSDRADDVDYGFSDAIAATAGFDVLTYTSLVTIDPRLHIAPGTNTAILSWSVSASNFSLESTDQLAGTPTWCPVTNIVNVVNNKNEVIVPTCGHAKYFRLYEP